jgi:hypothetical protein
MRNKWSITFKMRNKWSITFKMRNKWSITFKMRNKWSITFKIRNKWSISFKMRNKWSITPCSAISVGFFSENADWNCLFSIVACNWSIGFECNMPSDLKGDISLVSDLKGDTKADRLEKSFDSPIFKKGDR